MPVMTVGTGRALLNRNYIYALDGIPDVAVALSVRRLRSAYIGPCVRLRRSGDDAESDFGFLGNALDVSAVAAWLAGATGYVRTWYDQSGNGYDAGQSDTALQPTLAFNVFGMKPSVVFADTLFLESASNPVVAGGARTVVAVGRISASSDGGTLFTFRRTLRAWIASAVLAGGLFYVYSDGVSSTRNATVSDQLSTMRSPFIAIHRSAGIATFIQFRLNGTDLSVSQAAGVVAESGADGFFVGRRESGVGLNWVGDISEIAVMASSLSGASCSYIEQLARNYYGLS